MRFSGLDLPVCKPSCSDQRKTADKGSKGTETRRGRENPARYANRIMRYAYSDNAIVLLALLRCAIYAEH